MDKDLKASTLDKGENNCKKMEENTSMEVTKGEKRPSERELEDKREDIEEISFLEQVDKRIRFSGEDSNEQSKIIRPTLTKPSINNQKILSDDESKDDDDDDDEDDEDEENSLKTRRNPIRSIKIVPKRTRTRSTTRLIRRRNNRLSSKSSMPLRKPLAESITKKIKIVRRRSTSRTQKHKQSVAAWVKKYNIEDCCILLDLYNPIYETGRD